MLNIFFIGSSGALSLLPFEKLISENYNVIAVGVYNPIVLDKKIIALENASLALAANALEIPVIDLSQAIADVVKQCEKYAIDVILMSCYSKRLPNEIINLASKDCFNLHPSLLPGFRGAEPIFWQMKLAANTGVSWHQVVEEFDAGDIVAQKQVHFDDGASYAEINAQLAKSGADLMLSLLSDVTNDQLVLKSQDQASASYYPYPVKSDFSIDLNLSAQQIYNFMSATQIFSQPYLCQLGEHMVCLDEALDYDNNLSLEEAEVQGDRLYIPCKEGVLMASYTDKL